MEFVEQLLNCIPQHPLKETVEKFAGESIVIFKPRIIFKERLCSNNYQFVLPLHETPALIVEKKPFPQRKTKYSQ